MLVSPFYLRICSNPKPHVDGIIESLRVRGMGDCWEEWNEEGGSSGKPRWTSGDAASVNRWRIGSIASTTSVCSSHLYQILASGSRGGFWLWMHDKAMVGTYDLWDVRPSSLYSFTQLTPRCIRTRRFTRKSQSRIPTCLSHRQNHATLPHRPSPSQAQTHTHRPSPTRRHASLCTKGTTHPSLTRLPA